MIMHIYFLCTLRRLPSVMIGLLFFPFLFVHIHARLFQGGGEGCLMPPLIDTLLRKYRFHMSAYYNIVLHMLP